MIGMDSLPAMHIFITMQLESRRITIYKHHAKRSVGTYFKLLLYGVRARVEDVNILLEIEIFLAMLFD